MENGFRNRRLNRAEDDRERAKRKKECMNRCVWQLLLMLGISCGLAATLVYGQCGMSAGARTRQTGASRLAQLVEANVVATHAYQVLLARKSGKGDRACYMPG